MKYIAASMLAAVALTGCRDEHLMTEGEGTLRLSTTVNSNVEVVSRALTAEQEATLAESAVIWISNSKGLVHEFLGTANVPASLRLLSGQYTAEAWVGDSVPASWDKTFYKSGFQAFTIATGTSTDVTLSCRVANTLASVAYTPEALEMLPDAQMTVSLDDGITDGSHSLTFTTDNLDAKGYFMINSRTKGLTWTITGTQAGGTTFTKSGRIDDIKAATEYVLRVKYVGHDLTVGGAFLEIEVEEEPVGDASSVEVTLPPTIVGMLGFDKNGTFRAEEGKVGRKSMFISAGAALEDVEVTSSTFSPIVQSDRIEVFHITAEPRQLLYNAGIDWAYEFDEENSLAGLRFNLEEEFTDALPEGKHTFEIMALDALGHSSHATFTIEISNEPVASQPVPESAISYTSVTLSGTALKEASEYGFMVRQVSASRAYEDWTKVQATLSGSTFTATLDNLLAGATYEYKVYADDFVSTTVETFTTMSYPQLPNYDFELWSTDSDKALLPAASASALFWDTGNHGSQKMSKNVTTNDGSVKNSGNYSAKLQSQFVGVGSLGKFAAGNIFVGKFLGTEGTDGVLGWGRPWDAQAKPKALRGYARYTPGTVQKTVYDAAAKNAPEEILNEFPTGATDKGIVYIALIDDSAPGEYNGSSWPVLIKTKASDRSLFDKTASYVKAYGEIIFTEATSGSGMQEFTINLTDVNPGPHTHIMVVASASKGGDYFLGGEGSTLWLDDLVLEY